MGSKKYTDKRKDCSKQNRLNWYFCSISADSSCHTEILNIFADNNTISGCTGILSSAVFYACQRTWQEEALQHVTLHRPHGWSTGRLGPTGWCSASSALLKIEAQHECCFRATLAESCILLLSPPSYNEIYFVILFYIFIF